MDEDSWAEKFPCIHYKSQQISTAVFLCSSVPRQQFDCVRSSSDVLTRNRTKNGCSLMSVGLRQAVLHPLGRLCSVSFLPALHHFQHFIHDNITRLIMTREQTLLAATITSCSFEVKGKINWAYIFSTTAAFLSRPDVSSLTGAERSKGGLIGL